MTGKYFTFGGLLCFIGGAALFVIENPSSSFNTYDNQAHNNQGLFMMLGGEIMMDIGIPLWISGSIKASNNLKAREKSNLTSFELSTKGLGAQLILHF